MASKVYFTPVNGNPNNNGELGSIAKKLLQKIIKEENLSLEKEIPLKVHFGEKGNKTFIKPEVYDGIIDLLEEKKIKGCFIETNVMYAGERLRKSTHLKLAKEHGFTRIPIIIADGNRGEAFYEVEIYKRHFKTCKLGKEFSNYSQMLVLAHFKGHMMAGFGGAIKQLAMGCASRGGKIAQHLNAKPFIIPFLCKKCNACGKHCPEDAINLNFIPYIDHKKCVGCAACTAICPQNAIKLNMFKIFGSLGKSFGEKLSEYAYAAHKDRKNIYINIATDITQGCDCEGRVMEPIIPDIGIFASTDPVAIDQACFDAATKAGKKFKGEEMLKYAEEIGLGVREYETVTVNS